MVCASLATPFASQCLREFANEDPGSPKAQLYAISEMILSLSGSNIRIESRRNETRVDDSCLSVENKLLPLSGSDIRVRHSQESTNADQGRVASENCDDAATGARIRTNSRSRARNRLSGMALQASFDDVGDQRPPPTVGRRRFSWSQEDEESHEDALRILDALGSQSVHTGNLERRATDLQDELVAARAGNDELEQELSDLAAQRAAVQRQVFCLEDELDGLEERVESARRQVVESVMAGVEESLGEPARAPNSARFAELVAIGTLEEQLIEVEKQIKLKDQYIRALSGLCGASA